jgi:hypothetical protein
LFIAWLALGLVLPIRAAFHPVTLPEPARTNLAPLPAGLPSADLTVTGVPFKPRSARALTGMQDARQGQLHATEVSGVAVGEKTSVLHILHAIDGAEKDGVPVWSLVLHYANGEQETVRFAYGLQARSLSPVRHDSGRLADPNSSLAWQSTNRLNNRLISLLRVYRTMVANPRPEEKIVSLDLVSLFSRATPIVLAITTDDTAARGRVVEAKSSRVSRLAREYDDDVYHTKVVVRAQDAEGKPVRGATASLTISDLEGSYFFGRAEGDAQGLIRLSLPRQHAAGITIVVRAKDRIPFVYNSPKAAAGHQPSDVVAKLAAGSAAGGLVRSAAGQPVADARVAIYHLKQNSTRDYTRLDYDTVTTDGTGHWQTTALPAALDGFQFSVAHPDFRPRLYAMNASGRPLPAGVGAWTPDELRARTVAAELVPALLLIGTIQNEAGKPVAAAEARLALARNPDPSEDELVVRSDAAGRFKIPVLNPGPASLIILADGYGPEVQTVSLRDGGAPNPTLAITLKAGRRFVGRVSDQVQQPIAGAKIRLESWNDTRLLKFEAETDDSGVFTWTNAPEGQLRFYLSATNHSSTTYSISGNSPEHRFTLRKIPSVRGTVVDAETKQPISDFAVYRGRSYNYGEPIRWERYNTFRGRNGEYNIRLIDYGGSSTRTAVLIEAPGYMPAASEPISKPGLYTNNFQLKKARGVSGQVLAADGTPVPGVVLALVEPAEQAYLRANGDLSRSSDGGVQGRSDRDGRFQFSPRLDPHTIIASHARGFAQVRVTNALVPVTVTLQPWARVTGRVALPRPADRPHSVRLGNAVYRYFDDSRESDPLSLYLSAEADVDGTFRFERVPPGDRRVSLEHSVRVGDSTRSMNSHGVAFIIGPGESTNVFIGEGGRTIVGRMQVLGADPEDVDWKRDFHTLNPVRPLNMNLPQLDFSKAQTQEQQQELYAKQRKAENAFWRTPAGREYERAQVSYIAQFQTNGSFRIEGVPPGHYSLQVSPTDPTREDYSYEQIGSFNKEVDVPALGDGSKDPIDLGALEIAVRGTMRIGKKAPRFTVKSGAGQEIKLDDYRGRHVLIDFWATWSGSRSFDLRQLMLVHERYGKDPRLAMIGINLDHVPQLAEQELQKTPVPWTQCMGGTWNESPLRIMFGLRSLPENVLIDSEGKIAGFNLRGANILRVVERALGEPKPAATP